MCGVCTASKWSKHREQSRRRAGTKQKKTPVSKLTVMQLNWQCTFLNIPSRLTLCYYYVFRSTKRKNLSHIFLNLVQCKLSLLWHNLFEICMFIVCNNNTCLFLCLTLINLQIVQKWNQEKWERKKGVMKRAACHRPWKRQWSTSTTTTCLFLLVDVNHCLFRVVVVNLPFSTTGRPQPAFFNYWST